MRQNLIKRLQNKVKSQSVNSLKNIYPDKIVEWLEIPEREVYDLIKYLHDQRVIVFKYRLKCSCGEICTVYENKLIHDKQINCEICGKEFTISDIEEKSDIIYEIDKEELLELENGNVDFKILPDIKGKVVSITKTGRKAGAKSYGNLYGELVRGKGLYGGNWSKDRRT